MHLSNQFGMTDRMCIFIGGSTFTAAYVAIALATELWQLFIGFGAIGIGIGLFMGAFVNVPSLYVAKFYPNKVAQVPASHTAAHTALACELKRNQMKSVEFVGWSMHVVFPCIHQHNMPPSNHWTNGTIISLRDCWASPLRCRTQD